MLSILTSLLFRNVFVSETLGPVTTLSLVFLNSLAELSVGFRKHFSLRFIKSFESNLSNATSLPFNSQSFSEIINQLIAGRQFLSDCIFSILKILSVLSNDLVSHNLFLRHYLWIMVRTSALSSLLNHHFLDCNHGYIFFTPNEESRFYAISNSFVHSTGEYTSKVGLNSCNNTQVPFEMILVYTRLSNNVSVVSFLEKLVVVS